jgi:hypothetical protein
MEKGLYWCELEVIPNPDKPELKIEGLLMSLRSEF